MTSWAGLLAPTDGEDEVETLGVLLTASQQRQVVLDAAVVGEGVEHVAENPPAIRFDVGQDRRAIKPVDEREEIEDACAGARRAAAP